MFSRIIKFFSKDKKPEENKVSTKYNLKITFKDGSWVSYESPVPKELYKVYMWFLIRESLKYNLRYNVGQIILLRREIMKMEFKKI